MAGKRVREQQGKTGFPGSVIARHAPRPLARSGPESFANPTQARPDEFRGYVAGKRLGIVEITIEMGRAQKAALDLKQVGDPFLSHLLPPVDKWH